MSMQLAELAVMPEGVSSGVYIVWVFRSVLGLAMLLCVAPSLYAAMCYYFRGFLRRPTNPPDVKEKGEEEFVTQQLRRKLADGDHYNAFKLWQRAKSVEGLSSVPLVDVIHMLRSLGKSHEEVVGELRSAFECNPSLGDGVVEMLDDLRRRGMLGLLGKIISLLNEMDINCSGTPTKSNSKACDGCSSDDDISTQAARSECSTASEPSDDEEEVVSAPSSSEHPDPCSCQIPIAALLALRPRRGKPPAGYLHAVFDEKKENLVMAQSPPRNDRWECFRADGRDSLRDDCRSRVDRAAPWRKTTSEMTVVAAMTPLVSAGPQAAEVSVRANKPGSLSSSLTGSTALRPTRKL